MTKISLEEAEQNAAGMLLRVQQGESFTIEREGRAICRLEPVPEETRPSGSFRLGMLQGQGTVPKDIKGPFEAEINEMFYGDTCSS